MRAQNEPPGNVQRLKCSLQAVARVRSDSGFPKKTTASRAQSRMIVQVPTITRKSSGRGWGTDSCTKSLVNVFSVDEPAPRSGLLAVKPTSSPGALCVDYEVVALPSLE